MAYGLFLLVLKVLIFSKFCLADVSHFFASDLGNYFGTGTQEQQQNQPYPFQFAIPAAISQGFYSPSPTPVPVAPTTTTEFILPQVVENRLRNFIPLSNEYLPPSLALRPNYESPKPFKPINSAGYHYQRPATSTTTESSRPIVVQESNDHVDEEQVQHGYDYSAPVAVSVVSPFTPAPVYLPSEEKQQTILDLETSISPLKLRIKEMRCLQQDGGYFRTVLKLDSFLSAAPIVDNDSYDNRCELKLSRSYLVLDIDAKDFQKCGIHECNKDLCLRVRFPLIRGMRTGSDAILTLHCKTQQRIAAKTHSLKMDVANDVQSRSIGTYAHGGAQNPFRTHVELLRKSVNGFTHSLEPNGAVQLGEDILLRAHVIAGDGWNHTKLTDISLQRISASGEVLNTAQLINAQGCLNPSMQSICSHPPSFVPPLGHHLIFKAVMFQGMRSGDAVVMSMRITACLENLDCLVAVQEECSQKQHHRRKRDTEKNGTDISEISHISYRVVLPNVVLKEGFDFIDTHVGPMKIDVASEHRNSIKSLSLIGSLGFVVVFLCLAIFATIKLSRN